MLIVSPVAALTTSGPVTNMSEFSLVMTIRSVSAGQYTAPPAHGPQDQRDLRDEAAGVAGLAEDVAVLRQRGDAFLDAGAAGVDDRDDRHLQVQRHVHQVADLLAFGTTQRASP